MSEEDNPPNDILEELGRARQDDLETKSDEYSFSVSPSYSFSSPDGAAETVSSAQGSEELGHVNDLNRTILQMEWLYNCDTKGLFRRRLAFLYTSFNSIAPEQYAAFRINLAERQTNEDWEITDYDPAWRLNTVSRSRSSHFNYDLAGRRNEYDGFLSSIYKQIQEIQNEMYLYYGVNRMPVDRRGPSYNTSTMTYDEPYDHIGDQALDAGPLTSRNKNRRRTSVVEPIDPLNMPLNMGRPPNWPRHDMLTAEEVNTDGALSLAGSQDAEYELFEQLNTLGGVPNEVSGIINSYLQEEQKTAEFPQYSPAAYYNASQWYNASQPVYSYVRGQHATRNDIFRKTQ